MRLKTRKSVSKYLGAFIFLSLLLLKEAFPNAAMALTSANALGKCTADPPCLALIRQSSTPAVAAPIAKRNDEIGILVLPTGTFIPLYRWSQGTTAQAQFKAKQKYCATYPSDEVCKPPFTGGQEFGVLYKVTYAFMWTHGYYNEHNQFVYTPLYWHQAIGYVYGKIIGITREPSAFGNNQTAYFLRTINQQGEITGPFLHNPAREDAPEDIILSIERADGQPDTAGNPPPLAWKNWPQAKRDAAVKLLDRADWKGFIERMPLVEVFRPGDTVNAPPTIVIPGQNTDDPNTIEDDRRLKTVPAPYTPLPDYDHDLDGDPNPSDPDDDNDGKPDTSDPEPFNPHVPQASSDTPNQSEGEQAVGEIREKYEDFLEKPENDPFEVRLDAIEEKYRQAAQEQDEIERDWLNMEAGDELQQLENEIGEAWRSSLSQAEQQLFDIENRTQADIDEIQSRMQDWSPGTFEQQAETYEEGIARSILYHANDKGYSDPLEYLRDASNFNEKNAVRTPTNPAEFRDDGTARWENLNTGEFIVKDNKEKIRTYGVNP